MIIACVAFTKRALRLACCVRDALASAGDDVRVACPARLADAPCIEAIESASAWAEQAWSHADALIFVSACGIAVRLVAPLVRDKLQDPAVVCVDESASHAVALLSGHVGGANELAGRVATICGAHAVITTATDVNGVFAPDEWARRQGLVMLDRDEAKRMAAQLLEGTEVGFASDVAVTGELPHGVVTKERASGICVSYDAHKRPFSHTLRLIPRTVVVGVGCRRGTATKAILAHIDACLHAAQVAREAVCALASIDAKASEQGLLEAARVRGWDLRLYSARELWAVSGEFHASTFVEQTVGVDNVCERAACADGATLLLGKRSANGVTVAIAATDPNLSFDGCQPGSRRCDQEDAGAQTAPVPAGLRANSPLDRESLGSPGDLPICGIAPSAETLSSHPIDQDQKEDGRTHCVTCVGLGPGGADDLTFRAHAALAAAEVIVGYTTYVNLIRESYPQAEFVTTGMRGEARRCRIALERAARGERVAVVCSGDAGVYGMAGLLLELAEGYEDVTVEILPGVTAANGGAAVLGAPLMHDWCCVSLSDLMTPWDTIERRLRAAAQADFCLVLYNPASRGRADYLRRACDVLLKHKEAKTVCGMVQNIGRPGEQSRILTLGELREAQANMLTCVFVGNSQTKLVGGRMVTPRGYDVRPADARLGSKTPEVLVFGGTVEGRLLAEWLSGRGTCRVVYVTATDYGASLVPAAAGVTTLVGPLSQDEKAHLVSAHRFACIVDATHPYAQHISASIKELGESSGLDVVRIERVSTSLVDVGVSVASAQEAAQVVAAHPGNVLLTTGSRDLGVYVSALPDYKSRLYVRVLPTRASLEIVESLKIPASHVVAMQGPFSTELNSAVIRELNIAVVVTKQSGPAGGFDQKVQAAVECGVELVVIERPHTGDDGLGLEEARRLLEVRYGL